MNSKGESKIGKLVVVSGPSGVGKSTICRELVKRLDAWLSVSATTRQKSQQETDGVDYYFVPEEEFLRRIDEGDFLEWANVFGNLYGTPRSKIEERLTAGRTVILEIDVQGGKQVQDIFPNAVMIFVMPPSPEALAKRITGRGRDDQKVVKRRLAQAQEEMNAAWRLYGHIVVNEDLEDAIDEVVGIINKSGDAK